ncbi:MULTISPECIES: hypothetical protein [unclassified Streptococcus]|uniref:hypothetical protein n=1 Tax=unclassified Streptococcus TaxID=2608887 RepID=UPI001072EB9E|nr:MULTISPECIES: hypothetical protein [unclassified Streptococcus]MBF0788319.1 hypothetical protein [Streptococcus sp. 19428wC2_LYSM12]MCQ9211946.1 hypothetical protein [Streptococcus sp. B01]MCQ9213275.1 hypothetical protein [Streptococcus sp. O1]TFV04580.1 hypothetical protein E4T79_10550 [Streptococcus sp. LYSM12]
MDNFSLEIIWRDDCEDLLELKIDIVTEFVTMYQYCYISSVDLLNNMKSIERHIEGQSETRINFGEMTGSYTPSFSMLLYQKKANDDMLVELDLEIADNDERKHRCQLYVKSKADFWRIFSNNVEKMVINNSLSKSILSPY